MVKTLNPLEKCFADGNLVTVRPSMEKSELSLSQARYMLTEATYAAGNNAPFLALSGIYYAMFHAARAILFRDGIREKSHFCMERYLETYVSSQTLEKRWIILFGGMREGTEKNQFDLIPPATPEEIEELLILADQFINEMVKVLNS